ncbi:MAG: oligosaccharide flippase family protein [Desulfomonilaceae bacterium]|nr:oligosaccharide flippase family protein [Desulfomonilaceae bacterium]
MSLTKNILTRFAHLLSAQAVDGILTTGWFLYMAWSDPHVYGTIMYALAGGMIVTRVVQFGLYYALVGYLSRVDRGEIPGVLHSVNILKLVLLVPAMVVVGGFALYQALSPDVAWALFFVCLGFGLEVIADTFFADMRVRGRQDQEARIRMISSVASVAYAFLTTATGLGAVIVSLFKLVSAVIRIALVATNHMRTYSGTPWRITHWASVWSLFTGASVFALIQILGLFYNKTNVFFLERVTGVKGVALYSAAYNLVDPVSALASEQLLGWVIFPLLAYLWRDKKEDIGPVVHTSARWLLVIAFPIMLFLAVMGKTIVDIIYPPELRACAWMLPYLVWTIVLSFEVNLFAYVMMVTGAQRILLAFACVVTAFNLLFNVTLVQSYGLLGGCLVIIFTKLVMTALTLIYCQWRFRFFTLLDVVYPALLWVVPAAMYLLLEPHITSIPALAVTLAVYGLVVFKTGPTYLGDLPKAPPTRERGDPGF